MPDQDYINAKIKEREEKKRATEIADFEATIKTSHGRRVMWRLLEQTKFFADSYDDITNRMARNEGQRSIGKWAINEMMAARPEAFAQMQREAASFQAQEKQWLEKLTKEPEGD